MQNVYSFIDTAFLCKQLLTFFLGGRTKAKNGLTWCSSWWINDRNVGFCQCWGLL